MKLYHVTTLANARSILSTGFRDGTGDYGFLNYELSGVWLSDEPLTVNEGAVGDAVLSVELDLSGDQLANFEVIEEGRSFREFLVPADVINRVGCVTLDSMTEDNDFEKGPDDGVVQALVVVTAAAQGWNVAGTSDLDSKRQRGRGA